MFLGISFHQWNCTVGLFADVKLTEGDFSLLFNSESYGVHGALFVHPPLVIV